MNFKSQESAQKLRGGYYTPPPIADFLSRWALVHQPQRILEPSCGDGRFLQALSNQINRGNGLAPAYVDAVELIPQEAEKANSFGNSLRQLSSEVTIINDDFFNWIETVNGNSWDAIIGNPPYIRYQYFDAAQRDKAKRIFDRANVPFSKRTNAWVPFVMAGIMHLSPNGRLAMVIPAEILHVQHANGLRLLLEQEMASITLIHFRQIVFDDTLQGVLLLLAEKRNTKTFQPLIHHDKPQLSLFNMLPQQRADLRIIDLDSIDDLQTLDISSIPHHATPPNWNGNWMFALLNDAELQLLNRLQSNPRILPFDTIAKVQIGIVTGANKFFAVNDTTLNHYQLETIAAPMLAKSNLIQGILYTANDHETNKLAGKNVHFLQFPDDPVAQLPPQMADYINLGELQEIHTRYKCRIRTPWYVVPYVWVSEIALLKRCHHFPRLVLNELGAYSTDTAYRVNMKPAYKKQAKDLVFSFLNSLTFLYAELLGRHYGGGVLELVPSEIRSLRIPLVSVTHEQFTTVDDMIRDAVDLDTLLDYTDEIILRDGLDLQTTEIAQMRAAHNKLMLRRLRA
ncbi:MAG: class I SAM-dependent methyltransferase [Chloroflexi bacterium]|nr:class I SAM-dependent methyltransferase [Chloroflexota bacterium]